MGYDYLSPQDDSAGNPAAQAMKRALAELRGRQKVNRG